MIEINSGWFVKFTSKEKEFEEDLEEYLKENEYPQGGEGIKQFLKDIIYLDNHDKKEENTNTFFDALKENPEAVSKVVGGTIDLVNKAINKKIFKK